MRHLWSRLAALPTSAFAIGIIGSTAILLWFGHRGVSEWRTSSAALAERRATEGANVLIQSLLRDMSGAEDTLTPLQLAALTANHTPASSDAVAIAFARYPYPESFFIWQERSRYEDMEFLLRSERRPTWIPDRAADTAYPVQAERAPDVATAILKRTASDAQEGRLFSAFQLPIDGVPYQVIVHLMYSDDYRQRLAGVVGFLVNLSWVRAHYFSDLPRQVRAAGFGADAELLVSVEDQHGGIVEGVKVSDRTQRTQRRRLALAFFDQQSDVYSSRDLGADVWTVTVSAAADPALLGNVRLANRMLVGGAVAGAALAVGLLLVVQAGRVRADLTKMRSDFVSAVTHELKTPIATIRTAAETLSKGRLGSMTIQSCARIVTLETKRLTRLIENLLAYSRLADVADTYVFEPVPVATILNDVQQEFEAHAEQRGFELEILVEPNLPSLRADRVALRLLFDNLVDNAIKYSGESRLIRLEATRAGDYAKILVIDQGIGISPQELPLVTRRFVRGRDATSGGSGLGLAIADRIASDHRGSLQISSELGVGTTVSITLPFA
jgi:signal transduction histidine kinase